MTKISKTLGNVGIRKFVVLVMLAVSFTSLLPTLPSPVHAFSCPVSGGSNTIEGCVVNGDTGNPVPNLYVVIIVCGGFQITDYAISDGNGHFLFHETLPNGTPCINPYQSYPVSVNGVTPVTSVDGCYPLPSPCKVLGVDAYDLTWGQWVGDVTTDGNGHASLTIADTPGRVVMVPVAALYSNTGLASLSYTMSSSQTHSTSVSVSIGGGSSFQGSYTSSVTTTFSQTFNNAPNYASYLAAPYYAIGYYCAGENVYSSTGWSCSPGLQTAGTTIATGGQYQFIQTSEYLNPNALPTSQPHLDCTFSVPVGNNPWTWSYTQTGSTSTTFGVTSGVTEFGVGVSLSYSETSTSEKSDTTSVSFTTNGASLRFVLYPAGGTCPNPNANPVFGNELHVWDMSLAQDFGMTANPSTVGVYPGFSGSSTISLTSSYGFAGTASLSSLAPSGITVSFNPSTVSFPYSGATVTSTATISVASTVQAGTYSVTVYGTSYSPYISHSVNIQVGVTDFSVTSNPGSVTIGPNIPTTSTITATSLGGFTGPVNLGWSISPSTGLACSLNPPSTNLGSSGTSTLSCSGALGSYTVAVTGTSGQLSHSTRVSVLVTNFVLSSNPSSLSVTPGSEVQNTITATSVSAWSGSVTLTQSPTSTAVACWFQNGSPSYTLSVPSGGAASEIGACTGGTAGSYSDTFTGTSGTSTNSVNVPVIIQDFSMAAPSNVAVTTGYSTSTTISFYSLYQFSGTVNISALSSNSTAMTVTCFSSVAVPSGGSPYIWCTFSSGYTGTYVATITGSYTPTNYYYNARVSHSVSITVSVSPNCGCGGGGGGGSPWIAIRDSTGQYAFVNDILRGGMFVQGQSWHDTIDNYVLPTAGVPTNGGYTFIIMERNTATNYLDSLSAYSVDHPVGTHVLATLDGKMLTYGNPTSALSVTDPTSGTLVDVTGSMANSLALAADDTSYSTGILGSNGHVLYADLGSASTGNIKLIVHGAVAPDLTTGPLIAYRTIIGVDVQSKGGWTHAGNIFLRKGGSIEGLDLSSLAKNTNHLKVRLTYMGGERVDFIGVDKTPNATVTLTRMPLTSAYFAPQGDITSKLLSQDQNYLVYGAYQSLTVTFSNNVPAPANGAVRDIMIQSTGHYIT